MPPPHFTIFAKILYMYLNKEYYVEWGLVQGGNDAAETKKNLNASRGRYHICTEINRNVDTWLSIYV